MGFLSNSFTHEAFNYCVSFGSFAGEMVPVTFSKKALMLNKVGIHSFVGDIKVSTAEVGDMSNIFIST